MGDPFARAAARLLARLGQEAVLRGSEMTVVRIEHGVAVLGEYGELVSRKSTATMPSAMQPRARDLLTVGADAWIIDSIDADDGRLAECTVRPAT